jgi:amidase
MLSSCTTVEVGFVKEGEERMEKSYSEIRETLQVLRSQPRATNWVTKTSDVIQMSTKDLANAIRSRRLTSEEVVAAFLERILDVNERYNAIVTLCAQSALAKAREADSSLESGKLWGPLHGVPFTIKDTYRTAGVRTTAGYLPLTQYVPEENAVVVQRLLDAGAILLGKTNTPTLAMDMQTTNPIFGTTGNSVNADWSAGGSSGGASVAVALRMTPFDFGTDLAGSIRLPAAFNGVYGFRPTFGLVSMRGHIPPLPTEIDGIRRMAVAGPIAGSVEDLEYLLKIVAGPGPGDYRLDPLVDANQNSSREEGKPLRIVWTDTLGGVPVDTEIQTAMKEFIDKLVKAGLSVEQSEPKDFPYIKAWETWGAFVGLQGGYEQSNFMRSMGEFFTKSAVENTPMQRKIVGPISVPGYMQAMKIQDECIDRLEIFLEHFDVFVVPVSSVTAFPHFKPTRTFGNFSVYDNPMLVNGQNVPYYVATQAYTTIFSLTESPVVTIPIGKDRKGAPIGVQLIGHRFGDLNLLGVAQILDGISQYGLRP